MARIFALALTHGLALAIGFGAGVYFLPILTAPPGPDRAAIEAATTAAQFKGRFDRNLPGSDFAHWGEGEVMLSPTSIAHDGALAPGPDYKLYLAPEFVDTKEAFQKIKSQSKRVGDVKTFNGFIVEVPAGVDVAAYTTVVVWCEAFSQFITAAKYR
jgi:hypothetical protein